MAFCDGWFEATHCQGAEEINEAYLGVLEGGRPPQEGLVLDLAAGA